MAQGRWREILRDAGIPSEALADRRGRPCPKCGGRDRFAVLKDIENVGAVFCRHCFNGSTSPRAGDGLASLQWWLECSLAIAIRWLRSWLGVGDGKHRAIHRAIEPTIVSPEPKQSEVDRKRLAFAADVYFRNLSDDGREHLARSLGVTSDVLRSLCVGWCPSRCTTTWPMRNARGEIIGLRLRDPKTGAKRSVQGSAAGLFFDPDRFANIEPGARVWVAEGASDAAALLSTGLDAVGVPSAKSGVDLLLELGMRILPAEWVIVADGDGPGLESARLLRSELVLVAGARIIQPPSGIKDAREWINRGASRIDLELGASAAEVLTVGWSNGGAV